MRLRGLGILWVVALCVLMACGGRTPGVPGTRMHIVGTASGPIYEALRAKYAAVTYRAGQALRPGSLLLIDGASMSPTQMSAFEGIDRAMAAGASILILNADHAHKVALSSASPRIGAYVNGGHAGYLMTPVGSNGVDIVHVGPTTRRVKTHYARLSNDGILSGTPTDKMVSIGLHKDRIDSFVALVEQRLGGAFPSTRDSGTDPPSVVRRYIVSVTDSFIDNGQILPGQTLTQNVTFFFNVYENDGGTGQQFQWLAAYATGLSDPGTPSANGDRTRGYCQTSCQVSIYPDDSENGDLLVVDSFAPQASVDTYQGFLAFPIQYDGGAQTYDYQLALPGVSQAMPGWEVGPVSAPVYNGQSFWFFQTSPFSPDEWHDGFTHGGLVLDWTVKDMNPTSTTQFPLYCGAIFRTTFLTPTAIVMQYSVGSTYDRLHSHEKSPGIYEREHTPVSTEPGDPSDITLLFGRAS